MARKKRDLSAKPLADPNGRPYADYIEQLGRETEKASEKVKSLTEAMGSPTVYHGAWNTTTTVTGTSPIIGQQQINSAMNQVYTAGQAPNPPPQMYTATDQRRVSAELRVPLPHGQAMTVRVPVTVTRDDSRMAFEVTLGMQSVHITDELVYGTRRRPAEDVGVPRPVRKPKAPVRPPKYRDVA